MARGKKVTDAPIIVNADGYPIAHYLDTEDNTDTPQGSFKPLTQHHLQAIENLNNNLESIKNEGLDTRLTGSKVEYERVLDAVTIPATETLPSSEVGTINTGDESILFFQIVVDQPFRLRVSERTSAFVSHYDEKQVYPSSRSEDATTEPYPYIFAPIGRSYGSFFDDIIHDLDSIKMMQKKGRSYRLVLDNLSDDNATCSIEIVRVWSV